MLAKLGIPVTCTGIFGVWGNTWLDGLRLPQPYAGKVASLRALAAELTAEITVLEAVIADLLACHDGLALLPRRGKAPASWLAPPGSIRHVPAGCWVLASLTLSCCPE